MLMLNGKPTILGTDATLSGDLAAVDATLSGNLIAVDATLSGDLIAATDVLYAIKTVTKTIDVDAGGADDDFYLNNVPADATEQPIDCGAIIPAYASVIDCQFRCFETVAGSGDLTMAIDVGTASGGAQLLATADTDTANDINVPAAAGAAVVIATAAARNVWCNFTPTANWSTLTAGRWEILVSYIDYAAVHSYKTS